MLAKFPGDEKEISICFYRFYICHYQSTVNLLYLGIDIALFLKTLAVLIGDCPERFDKAGTWLMANILSLTSKDFSPR
jgi:hypothetical protein